MFDCVKKVLRDILSSHFQALTYHVESTHVTVLIHEVWCDLSVIVRVNSVRSCEEPKESGVWMQLPSHVEETHDNIVSTGCLAS